MGRVRGWGWALIASALTPAFAHIVYGGPTILQLLQDADLVVRARIVESSQVGGDVEDQAQRPLVMATVLDAYKGAAPPGALRFAQHGHGVAQYQVGDEALLFLRRSERSRELDELAVTGTVAWVSLQEHDNAFKLTSETRPAFERAVRGYLAALAEADDEARLEALGRMSVGLLHSDEPRLRHSALRDLVLMGSALGTEGLASELIAISEDTSLAIGVRLGVVAVLEQQGLVDGPERWAQLLRDTQMPDLLTVVRAAGAHPSPPVTTELVKRLAAGDEELAAAAAISLGVPGNRAAVGPLARALESPEERLRMSAIRALGRIATDDARALLRQAAEDHPDRATRRRAAGEVARLEGK